jgi:hypothetical protein
MLVAVASTELQERIYLFPRRSEQEFTLITPHSIDASFSNVAEASGAGFEP